MAIVAAGCGSAEESQLTATAQDVPAASGADESRGCVDRATFATDEPEDSSPSWSPDGRRIAFHSTRNGDFEIWTIDVETCAAQRLVPGEEPDWSPDGDRLVFSRFEPAWATTASGRPPAVAATSGA